MDLGSVSGDTGNATVTGSGYESAWFKVRVTEDDSSPFATPMKLTVNLTSPPGVNFDLYLYVNSGSDVVECSTASGQSMSTGTADRRTSRGARAARSRTAPTTAARSRSRSGR